MAMYEVKSIIRPERLAAVVHALHEIPDVPGLTVSVVRVFGKRTASAPATSREYGETEMVKLEAVVPETLLKQVVDTVQAAAGTGRPGDGKVFISRVEDALTILSGAPGAEGLKAGS